MRSYLYWDLGPPNWRTGKLVALAILLFSLSNVRAQQPASGGAVSPVQGRVKILEPVGPWELELLRQPGTVIAEGQNIIPIGVFRLKSYRIEEVTLREPIRAEVDRIATQIDKAWKVSVTGGPFRVRDAAAVIWIDGKLIGFGLESQDLKSISVLVFDRSLLRNGATIALSYGENDPARTELPETINVSTAR
ncbi:MAG TPA: hypothetical protein VI756_27660 [Blastocatellia bacterium]